MTVRVIALGNAMARDDGAAIAAASKLEDATEGQVELLIAGRPGPGLLDLLDPDRPTVLMDVVRRGAAPGALVELGLGELATATIDGKPISSHGMGVAQAFRLAIALGRTLPRGRFVGIGGRDFEPGEAPSAEVARAIDDLVAAARRAISELEEA